MRYFAGIERPNYLTKPLNHFFQLKINAIEYLVVFLTDSDLNLDTLVQSICILYITL